MFISTAFLFGFISSFHCAGMCGPIAISLPNAANRFQFVGGKLLYNAGRITTYILLGALFGLFGKGLALAGVQQAISVALGVALLIMALLAFNPDTLFQKVAVLRTFQTFIIRQFGRQFKSASLHSMYIIGLLNGLLPCGVVYIALAGSLTTGNAVGGMAYMAVFGLGTLPMMLFISLAGKMVSFQFRNVLRKASPAVMFFFAVLLILRGLNLNIPYISPRLSNDVTMTGKCH
jgi:sulfite exporter TauE/SafE